MKSAHKLALALGIFLALTTATYFIYTAIQGANSAAQLELATDGQKLDQLDDATARLETQRSHGKILGSTVDESAAVEPTLTKQVAPVEPDAGNLGAHEHLSIAPIQSTSDTSPKGVLSSPDYTSNSSQASSTEDLLSFSSTTTTTTPTPTTTTTTTTTTPPPPPTTTTSPPAHSALGNLLITNNNLTNPTSDAPPQPPAMVAHTTATPTTGVVDPSHAHAHNSPIAPFPATMTAGSIYREATERPRSQLVDLSDDELQAWAKFKLNYGRKYRERGAGQKMEEEEEEDQRRTNFIGNLRFINVFNQRSQALFKLGLNHLADYNQTEINELFIGPKKSLNQHYGGDNHGTQLGPKLTNIVEQIQTMQEQEPQLYKSINYYNLTGPVEDQGQCRESSIFAAIGALETAINAARSEPIRLSARQLMDCLAYNAPAPPAWPPVCSGHLSLMHLFDFLQRQAIRFSRQEEYENFSEARRAGRVPANLCMLPPTAPETRYRMSSYGQVMRENLDEALASSGPLVVALDASQPTFHFYKSGLYHEEACSSESYNYHALLVAANYSDPDSQMAPQQLQHSSYTVRASLGPDWGTDGYMQLLRDGQRNKCLSQHTAVYPNIGIE